VPVPQREQGSIIHNHERECNTYIVYIFVDGETGQLGRFFRETPEDSGCRQVFPGGRNLTRERQALQIPTHIPERPRRAELLLHGDEAHIEAKRDRLGFVVPPLEALEYVRRDAQIRTLHHQHRRISRSETHLPTRIAIMLERDELRLRREPSRERLAPREHTIEAFELERAIVKYAHVVSIHRPFALARLGDIDRRGDAEIFEVDQKLHHPCHQFRIAQLGLPVHRTGKRETLHATSEIGPREYRAAEVEQPLFGDGDVFVELVFHVGSERMGYETEGVVKVGGVYELQYGQEKLWG
jgi:hypothetical protein